MNDKTRLEWVANNRCRGSNLKPIGSQIAGLLGRIERESSPVEEAVARIAGIVDGEFRELCRIEGIEKGVLRIGVVDASAVSSIMRTWSGRLRAAMPTALRIKRIAFAYGTRGHRID